MTSLRAHRGDIESSSTEGKRLLGNPDTPSSLGNEVSELDNLSREVSETCEERQKELEQALEDWKKFNSAVNGFKEALAKGEVELTRKKSVNVTGIELINEQQHDIKVT